MRRAVLVLFAAFALPVVPVGAQSTGPVPPSSGASLVMPLDTIPLEGEWLDVFGGFPSTDAPVDHIAVLANGDLVLAGRFSSVAGTPVAGLARWDGARAHAYEGFEQARGWINAILPWGDSLLVAGSFEFDDGRRPTGLLMWTGAGWVDYAVGLRNAEPARLSVLDLAVAGDTLYACGTSTHVGGVESPSIARRVLGGPWEPLGTGLDGPGQVDTTLDNAFALAVGPGGMVYVGGYFEGAGDVAAHNLAAWDGAAWHAVGTGIEEPVRMLETDERGDLLIVSSLWNGQGPSGTVLTRWDGTTLERVGETEADFFSAVRRLPDGRTLVSAVRVDGWSQESRVLEWMDGAFLPVSDSVTGTIHDFAPSGPGAFVAAGGFFTSGGGSAVNLARWDGTWQSMIPDENHGLDGRVDVVKVRPDGIYAAGMFRRAGGVARPYIARWHDGAWFDVGPPLNGPVFDLAFLPGNQPIVSGNFTGSEGTSLPHLAILDGDVWKAPGDITSADAWLVEACPDGSIYANSVSVDGTSSLARWDGLSWTAISAYRYVVDLLCTPDGTLYAGGQFSSIGGVASRGLARWNGSEWTDLSAGMSTFEVQSFAWDPVRDRLAVGGSFGVAGPEPGRNLGLFGPFGWETVADETDGIRVPTARSVAVDPDGRLVLGSTSSSQPSSPPFGALVAWADGRWYTFGEGIGRGPVHVFQWEEINGLDRAGDLLAIGGHFSAAGGLPANNIALWRYAEHSRVQPVPYPTTLEVSVFPNPASSAATITVRLERATTVSVDVFDVLGRRVAVEHVPARLPSGRHALPLDLSGFAPGVYAVRVTAGDAIHRTGLVRIR